MRLAHLILAHHKAQQLERLVKRLNHTDADIYIQLDKKANYQDFKFIADNNNVWFVDKRIKTGWGDYSIIEATLAGMQYILDSGKEYSHINLMSGQDYPLRPNEEIHKFLFANPRKSFIHSLSIADDEWPDGKVRITKYSLGDTSLPGKYRLQTLVNLVFRKRKIPYGLKPYGRSQWMTITPEAVRYTIDYLKIKPKLKLFFKLTWAVDEIFFQTILFNSPLKGKMVNDNLRYIDMHGANRPTIFTIAHADELLGSGKFYARKFDTDVDSSILDHLDKIAYEN
jgi:hypothetical protein